MMICRGELYKRQKNYRLGYLYIYEAYNFSKMLQDSLVSIFFIP